MFPKTSLPRFYYADMHGYYAGFDGFFLPHFYHHLYNSLIINKLNSLHRQVNQLVAPFQLKPNFNLLQLKLAEIQNPEKAHC